MTTIDLDFEPALNVYGAPYVGEGETPRWALYRDTGATTDTGYVVASGEVPADHPLYGAEDEWLYGDDARAFLAAVTGGTLPIKDRWSTDELRVDFEVIAFAAPFVQVRRRSDNQRGWLMFDHNPRVYYRFTPED